MIGRTKALRPTAKNRRALCPSFCSMEVIMKKALLIMASILSMVGSVFAGGNEYKTAEIYDSMRNQVLNLKSDQFDEFSKNSVLCVLMETGYPEAVATLVSVADGAASIYFSNGGGIIGAGEHPQGKEYSLKLVESAKDYLKFAKPDKMHLLPKPGNTKFYFVTPKGVLAAEAKEDDLGNNKHKLSPLFHKAHELIYVIQLIEKEKKAEQ